LTEDGEGLFATSNARLDPVERMAWLGRPRPCNAAALRPPFGLRGDFAIAAFVDFHNRSRVAAVVINGLPLAHDGLGFSLVPWRPALEQHIGRQISGVATPGGDVNWSLGRKLGLGV